MFSKSYVYQKGGRPVIYDKTEEAKKYLPPSQWWRIVNLDVSDNNNVIDWTHEREWRVPGDFEFELSAATLLVITLSTVKNLSARLKETEGLDLISELGGIVTLQHILY
jgi:hypothetical protein